MALFGFRVLIFLLARCDLLSRASRWWREPFLLASAVLLGLMFYCSLRVLVPFERAAADSAGAPRGNLSDLYPRWIGAREVLLHGEDPYSVDVTQKIQAGYYGRLLDPARPGDPKDEQRFAYPLYVVFFLAPFIHLPFETVQHIFTVLLGFLCACSVVLWPESLGLCWSASTKTAVVLLTFSTLQVVQGLARLQLSLLVFAFVSFGVWFMAKDQLWLGGFAFAAATIKPQLVLLPIAFLVLWASVCRARRTFLLSFALGMTILFVGADLLQHGWIFRFLSGARAYHKYAAGSILDFILPPIAAWTIACIIVAMALGIFWRVRESESNSPDFRVALALAMAVTTVVVPIGGGYNQLFVLPGLFVLVANRARFQSGKLSDVVLFWSPWIVLALPWIAALVAICWHALNRVNTIVYRIPYMFAFVLPFFVLAAMSAIVLKSCYGARARTLPSVASVVSGRSENAVEQRSR
jgi:hypothetical protein